MVASLVAELELQGVSAFAVVVLGLYSTDSVVVAHRLSCSEACGCWRRLLRIPWTARKSNLSVLKEINPEHSLEGLMLKLRYLGYLIRRANSLEKTLMLGKTEGRRRRG